MTDYSKMSDAEINQSVGKIVSRDGMSIIASDGNAVVHKYSDVGDFKGICLGWMGFDPCNNPADAWPIIAGNGIGVSASKREPFAWDTSGGMLQGIRHSDKNPLRAAMIVFLMMKEAGNV